MDMDYSVKIDCGSGSGGMGGEGQRRKNWDIYNRITIKTLNKNVYNRVSNNCN